MSAATSERAAQDRQWYIAGRWQEYEGEARANLLRVVGITAFYAVELLNYRGVDFAFIHLPKVASVTGPFHAQMTALCAAWILVSGAVLLALRKHYFPEALKYVSTAFDLLFLTAVLLVADGPQSPLLVGYFLMLTLAALRFNLNLVRFATLGGVGGYLFLIGNAFWLRPQFRVPRYHELIFLLALSLTGIIMGQIIRRVRAIAEDFADRISAGAEA